MGKEVVRELIQDDLNKVELVNELGAILIGGKKRDEQLINYARLHQLVGGAGASERAGRLMVGYLTGIGDK